MILTDIREFFSRQQAASLAELSLHFRVDADAMRGMLDQWIRKGKLQKLPQGAKCSGCCESTCDSDSMEIYHWIG
jgi:hypothetical protein